ncbi:NADH-quinone oxidoreductase subunit M [Friedmanniella endophytica]|uniref:NADH-quinone oxidoreductase subunit M n=1 Tax=Microlunatus kandeliicorticis TaxID=1759536 RepID=A0A7W3IPE0_9ACTN|nr:NADH-quinone oxidoreductase subunit M [Microlunatus kandeliicorticis]MBA8792791.1 NADH-quinone oxidoreductase subunit M [Microlunatus kandeliicorticis]
MSFPWLTVLALLPLVGAVLMLVVKGPRAKPLALAFSLATLVLAVVVALQYRPGGGMQFVEQVVWIRPLGAHYALGLDGIGLTLVLLTAVLTPIVMIASWNDAEERKPGETDAPEPGRNKWGPAAFMGLVLCIESFGLFAFTSIDVFLFYLFFEVILIPMYFLIGAFGGSRRSYAAGKFLLFGLFGGFVMLASVIGLYVVSARAGTPSYLLSDLMRLDIPETTGRWLFVGFMVAFAIKAPLVPFHSWMPDAAEQSTPGGAVLLAGVLDKVGTFGMIRFCLYLFPEASRWATPVVLTLATVSIIYGALMAIVSKDLHRLIGWTSISHFGFIVLGIFAFTSQSMVGSTLYMLNHGLSTAALFLAAGFMIKRRNSRQIGDFGGVQKVAPVLTGLLLFAGLSTMALPGLSSFVSEFMVLGGTFSRHPAFASIATVGIVLAALYVLIMYQRTATGPVTEQVREHVTSDLGTRERLALAPLVLLILVLGFFPKPLLGAIEPTVAATMTHVGVSDPAHPVAEEGR